MKQILPTFLNVFIVTLQGYAELYFVSRYGSIFTAAYGMGLFWLVVFGTAITSGLGSGLDTLCCQAIGKGDYKACGLYMNKARVAFSIIAICLTMLTFISDRLLILLGVDPQVCKITKIFLYSWMPCYLINAHWTITRSFMHAHQVFYPQMYITSVLAVVHPLWCWLFSKYFGYIGVGIASNFTDVLNLTATLVYVYRSKIFTKSIIPFKLSGLHNWGYFIKTIFWGCLMTCIEWWATEINSLIAAQISIAQLAANFSINSIYLIYFYLNSAVGTSTITMVGNSIGENSITKAKYYMKLCILNSLTLNLCASIILLAIRSPFSYLFSIDAEVRYYMCNVTVMISGISIIDAFETFYAKILIALGKQKIGFYSGILSYYAIVLPLSYLLAIRWHLGIYGLWISLGTGMSILLIIYFSYAMKANWEDIAIQSQKEISKETEIGVQ